MRTIEFRGKTVNDGKWICGDLEWSRNGVHCYITEFNPQTFMPGKQSQIHSATLGEYTGITDDHGNPIFEGDIIQMYAGEGGFGYVAWHPDGYFYIVTPKHRPGMPLGRYLKFFKSLSEKVDKTLDITVIGNIHDNTSFKTEIHDENNQDSTNR